MGLQNKSITQDMIDYWKYSIPDYQFYLFQLDESLNGTISSNIQGTAGTQSFNFCQNLVSLNLPNVKAISESAFHYCSQLTTINLPECTNIGSRSFENCKLTNLYIPKLETISSNAFNTFYSSSIELPATLITIDGYAFYSSHNLTAVTIGDAVNGSNLTSIGSTAFQSTSIAEINIYAPKSQVTTAANAPWGAPSTCQVNWLGGE